MASTQYQVLYRYTNPNSNQLITNDSVEKYKNIFELYHEEHKIATGTDDEKLEANNEKSEMIVQGNSTSMPNYSMLFKFAGTKRMNKKEWVPEKTGYIIREEAKESIRHLVTRAVDGDFSGDYLLIEGDSIENGLIVAKNNPVQTPIVIKNSLGAKNKLFFKDEEEIYNYIVNLTIGKLVTETSQDHGILSAWSSFQDRTRGFHDINIKVKSDFDTKHSIRFNVGGITYRVVKNALTDTEYEAVIATGALGYSTITISSSQIATYMIPAHFENTVDMPYVACDTYEQIEQSPWFILSTHASLNSALKKATKLVQSVGIENVKLIKTVPTDQFIKIK